MRCPQGEPFLCIKKEILCEIVNRTPFANFNFESAVVSSLGKSEVIAVFTKVSRNKAIEIFNFGRLPVCQFSLDKKNSDLGYFYLYLQHILGKPQKKSSVFF